MNLMPHCESFGDYLRRHRLAAELSLSDVAEMWEVTVESVDECERGLWVPRVDVMFMTLVCIPSMTAREMARLDMRFAEQFK